MSAHFNAPPKEDDMQTRQNQATAHPAFAESAANLSHLLHGLVSRWETLDLAGSAACFTPDAHLKAWQEADAADLPRAYERA